MKNSLNQTRVPYICQVTEEYNLLIKKNSVALQAVKHTYMGTRINRKKCANQLAFNKIYPKLA